jgi:hypothetical protein
MMRLAKRMKLPPRGYQCVVRYSRRYRDGFISSPLHPTRGSAERWVNQDPQRYAGVVPVLLLMPK